MIATDDGEVLAGSIPQAVVDEYKTEGFQLPCFAGAWAAAGCVGAATVAFFACERRADNNIARMSAACASSGMSVEINSISGCGSVESHCVPNIGQEHGDGSDGGEDDPDP